MLAPGRYDRSQALLQRAERLIPGGYHLSGRPLLGSGSAPLYMERGKGSRVWDVDGNEYIDFVMAYGPYLLGYAHPEVDRAAMAQIERGSLLSLNHPLHLKFIERVVQWFPGAEMGVFFKSGSEATTAALRVARRLTGRRNVARSGYHGWHDWCLPTEDFVPSGLDSQVQELTARDPATLERIFDESPGQIAAVIVAPEMVPSPTHDTFARLLHITHRHGAVFILDEVKTAFRIAPGSVQERLGIIPDMTTVSKALGNGWPVAALVGKREIMMAGAGMHYSATFHGDTAPMAAALAVLDILKRRDPIDVQQHVWRLGERLIAGLEHLAARHGVPAQAYGEPLPPMPFLRFCHPDAAVNEAICTTFYTEMMARGILLHPRHLWFVSAAHSEEDIARTLAAADESMAIAANAQD